MEDTPFQELLPLIFQYLDKEKLIKENPSITEEMIDTFIQEISHQKKGKKSDEGRLQLHSGMQHKTSELDELIIHTDGASRGNPGKAGIGIVIYDKEHHIIEEACRYIGKSTNNVAEYRSMILAAQKAIHHNAKRVIFKTDSELLVRQLNGIYRVKSASILPLYNELMALLHKISVWKIQHVRREENIHADALANQGIDDSLER
ncbi:MAG: ribonuclease HI family protein [Candidatus Jettenia caeni]|nr:MAG: ribonuclease HI family protein [Candidatus Jettenia caeni]